MVGTSAPFLLDKKFTDFPTSNPENHILKRVHPNVLCFTASTPRLLISQTQSPFHPPQSKVLYGITNWINFPLTKDIGKQVGIVILF
jgi:hypothetical protein